MWNFQTREFAELINYSNTSSFPKTYHEWLSLPRDENIQFIQLAQQMESLGLLLAEKLIDMDLVDKTLGSFVASSWEKYKPIILQVREKNPDPYLAEYFQWMAELIKTRMKEDQRKPFFQS